MEQQPLLGAAPQQQYQVVGAPQYLAQYVPSPGQPGAAQYIPSQPVTPGLPAMQTVTSTVYILICCSGKCIAMG